MRRPRRRVVTCACCQRPPLPGEQFCAVCKRDSDADEALGRKILLFLGECPDCGGPAPCPAHKAA